MSLSNLLGRAHAALAHRFTDAATAPNLLFFSFTDGTARSHIVRAAGASFAQAWKDGATRCQAEARRLKLAARWLRVDWPVETQATTWAELAERLKRTKRNYFRMGLALDAELRHAFLEPELNANAMLYLGADKAEAGVNPKNFTVRAQRRFGKTFEPDFSPDAAVYVFTHEGLFVSDDPAINALPDGSEPNWLPTTATRLGWRNPASLNAGRRQIPALSAGQVYALIESSANFLARQVKKNGQFIYGHFPCFGRQIPTYNALRHASSVYSMLEGWELTRNDALLAAIRRGLTCLADTLIRRYPQPDGTHLAYNVDVNGEIKLGANAVSLLALVKYDELTHDTRYRGLMEELALGIARMQDANTGKLVHVLNSDDLSVKEAFRIVYYDGEAAFGLMRLYGLTRDPRWLAIVEKAFDYFIANDHWKHHDHWLSYCANELTLYKPEEKYFRFGVQNIAGYLDFILTRETTYPTLLELSMAFEAMLRRINTDHPEMRHVLDDLDIEKFHRALHHRAHYLLNGFFWPELAMYYAKPQTIVGSFFIRHHTFRVRIDDIEHYLSGYVAYWKMLRSSAGIFKGVTAPAVAPTAAIEHQYIRDNWNSERILRATRGSWRRAPQEPATWSATGVSIWRPSMEEGHLVALRAEGWKRGVPTRAIESLPFKPRAILIKSDAPTPTDIPTDIPLLEVEDMSRAIFAMGHFSRHRMQGRVIGVTGSAGKTTLVGMLAHTLREWGSVGSTKHNSNLPIGIAWNLASIPWDSAHVVLEMAIGGMRQNTALARPHVAVFSNIEPAHLEYHHSTEEIARKKARIFSGMEPGSVAILNRDMNHWDEIAQAARQQRLRVLSYGRNPQSDFVLLDYHAASRTVHARTPCGALRYHLGAPGLHMAYNSLACLAVIDALGFSQQHAASRMAEFGALEGRGRLIEITNDDQHLRVVDEAYNANPASMAAALSLIRELEAPKDQGRRVIILGDMLELGPNSREYHRNLKAQTLSAAPNLVLLCGPEMHALYEELEKCAQVHWFEKVDMLNAQLSHLLQDGDLVLVKSSAGTQLSKTVEAIKQLKLAHNHWPCPISPDTSDGMMMPGEKKDDTQQKNIH